MTAPRLLLAALLAAAAAAFAAAPAGATNECRGLQVCISVAGPWVAVAAPTRATPFPSSTWLIRCPGDGLIAAGTDAVVSDRAVDVSFLARLGSPVNPGVTTRQDVLFTGTYTGTGRPRTSFKPLVGCVPTSGGGRETTAYRARPQFPAGEPTRYRERTIPVRAGRVQTVFHHCAAGERLISGSAAVGFFGGDPPTASAMSAVTLRTAVTNGRLAVTASATDGVPTGSRVEVQLLVRCAGGGR